jgi:hypothetical protein
MVLLCSYQLLVLMALMQLLLTKSESASLSTAGKAFSCPVKAPVGVSKDDQEYKSKPYVDGGLSFIGGETIDYESSDCDNSTSPIVDTSTGRRIVIGRLAKMGEADAIRAVEAVIYIIWFVEIS